MAINRKKGTLKAQITRLEANIYDTSLNWTKVKLKLKSNTLEKVLCNLHTLRIEFYEIVPEMKDILCIEADIVEIQERIEVIEVNLLTEVNNY